MTFREFLIQSKAESGRRVVELEVLRKRIMQSKRGADYVETIVLALVAQRRLIRHIEQTLLVGGDTMEESM